MRRNKAEKEMIQFLQKYPNQWHSFAGDAVTMRTVATLHLLHNLTVDLNTMQMKWEAKK